MHGWRVTSTYGGRINPVTGRPGNHGGMDLAYWGCEGEPILAPCAGLCAQSWDPGGGGNWTGIVGDDGCYWGLGHAVRFAPGVAGRRVAAGQVVAYVGTTGKSTGAHLHVSYRPPRGRSYTDPHDLLAYAAVRHAGPAQLGPIYTGALEGDWLDMATEDDVRRIVREVMAEAVGRLTDRYLVVDGREGKLSAWLVSGLHKVWLPDGVYTEIMGKAGAAREANIRDMGMRGHGDPYIALLDLAAPVGPVPPGYG